MCEPCGAHLCSFTTGSCLRSLDLPRCLSLDRERRRRSLLESLRLLRWRSWSRLRSLSRSLSRSRLERLCDLDLPGSLSRLDSLWPRSLSTCCSRYSYLQHNARWSAGTQDSHPQGQYDCTQKFDGRGA